ncbi:MAG: response regulator transcription factor [Muribaculaceae bacterium]|nr:response regulator transcription factor [Muribaculaceae bacterium]
MKDRILLVEDEETLSMIISDTLVEEGFDVVVKSNGVEGINHYRSSGADLVIADVMMPLMDGFEMARKIRALDPDVPVVFLTARSSIDDMEEGFDIGCNDYIKKPFKMRELIIRVQALLKRRSKGKAVTVGLKEVGRYVFDTNANRLTLGDIVICLTNIESIILSYLSAHEGETVESGTLMKLVWKHDDYYNRNSLHGFIHKLRNHLRHDPSVSIINLRGIGYRMLVARDERVDT